MMTIRDIMLKTVLGLAVAAALCLGALPARGAGALTPSYLRCEYKVDPLGIDVMQPRLGWLVTSSERAQTQSAYRILVAESRAALDADKGDAWDSGRVESGETALIPYAGAALKSQKQYFWKVRVWDGAGQASAWSAPATWSMGLLDPAEWQAQWIGLNTSISKKQQLASQLNELNKTVGKKVYFPSPFLRKEFQAAPGVKRAMVYASALGFFELYLNGNRVGRDSFTPGWTDYNKRVYYLAYDVTNLVRAGDANAFGAILADGWYAGNIGGRGQRLYGSQLRLLAQLHIEYEDGATQVVATDGSWKAAYGPVIEADMQDGETYDARREMPGWNEPGLDESQWKPVQMTDKIPAQVQAYPGIPVRKIQDIKPVAMTQPAPGVFIFDMGQNFAGCERLRVKGAAGDKVVLRFGEMLNSDGTLYTTNLRGARATDSYTLKGGAEEVWEPDFTYHGYRYVEVTGYPGTPGPDAITGVVMHSDLPLTSSFESSNALANQIYSNIVWGQRSNYFEVPTDCPQRDERLGWMGDAQIFVGAAAYNMDIGAFMTKWMQDVVDGQDAEGGFPDVAPFVAGRVTAGWGDAGVICPWTIHRVYGDTRIINTHYAAMKKWMEFLDRRSPGRLSPSLGSYGDWLHVNDPTDNGLISTAYFAHDAVLMAGMARATGRDADAESYKKMFGDIKKSFRRIYLSTDGSVAGNSQTGHLLALHFGLMPDKMRARAETRLVDLIRNRDWSLSTGFLGCGLLLPTLTEIGRTDVAYRLLTNRKYPSWGYSIDQGATTMWERWNSYTKENGFGDPGMNSFNHYAFGAVGEWMFSTLAGIDTDGPGYGRVLIRPRPGGDFSWVRASYDSIRGRIATEWKIQGNDITLTVSLPANTTATVYVPATGGAAVTESGKPAATAPGVKFLRDEPGFAVFETGSGDYSFISKSGKSVLDVVTGAKGNE